MEQTKKIRSVQVIDSFFPVIDGVVETVHNYAQYMGSVVMCPRMTRHYERVTEKLPYEVVPGPTFRIPFSQFATATPFFGIALTKKLKELQPDIIHIHSPALLGMAAASAGHRLGIPVVGTFHSKVYDATLEFTKSKLAARFVTWTTVKFYEKCDVVWACSEGTAETLHSYGYHGDISVMTNGTKLTYPEDAEDLKAAAAEKLQLPKDKHILLFVGQMVWYKNIRLILDTFRRLLDHGGNYCLVLVGTGRDVNAIRSYAQSLGLSKEQVIITGKVSDQKLLSGIYLNADLFFFPSVFDNTPLVMREAAVMGVPTLATEGSNTAEPIKKYVNGFTAPENADAMCGEIEKIFSDPAMLAAAGKAAQATIPMTWESLAPVVEEKYRKIIAEFRQSL